MCSTTTSLVLVPATRHVGLNFYFVSSRYTCPCTCTGTRTWSIFSLAGTSPVPACTHVCVLVSAPIPGGHQLHCCGALPVVGGQVLVLVFHHHLHGSCTCNQECRRLNFYFVSASYKPAAGSGRPWPVVVDLGRFWQALVDRGRFWWPVAGCGRPWQVLVARGRFW